jgi:nicotinate-nucleotide adenylyltransferase
MKKIGLLGGTFDPPHIGHLIMAEEARLQCGLEEVWWMPNKIPPHKEKTDTKEKQRVEMVEQMVRLSPSFALCLKEMERDGPSYTADTLLALKEEMPDTQFHFIMGGDSFENFHLWARYEELQSMIPFIVMKRPGSEQAKVKKEDFIELNFIDRFELNISSSEIREGVNRGTWNKFLVINEVNHYIKEHRLYE